MSHQVPIFTACFVSPPWLVDESLKLFTQALCFWPLLYLEELQAELNPASTKEHSVQQQTNQDGLTLCSKELIPLWIT